MRVTLDLTESEARALQAAARVPEVELTRYGSVEGCAHKFGPRGVAAYVRAMRKLRLGLDQSPF